MTSGVGQRSAAIDGLRVSLRTNGYTSAALRQWTSAAEAVGIPDLGQAVAYVQTDGVDEPMAVLTRLFWICTREPRERVERLVTDLDLDALAEAGVLAVDGENVRSELRIDEVFGLLVAWDVDLEREDYVVGVSASTRLAATHTPRVPADAALDMGCGQGFQALLAARHCRRVIATDFVERALWVTELNARLNEIGNVETRQGSFLEPVEGERFDLVVMNPPYVISPGARFHYRDGGLERDTLSRTLLAGLPGHLEEGGFGVLQGNWIHADGERWFAPIEQGLARSGCDALLARISTADPLEYAAGWNGAHHAADASGFAHTVREWVDYFDEQDIERVSAAMVVLRRRDGARNWRRAVSLARRPERLSGERLAALFGAQDRLAALDDERLLDTVVAVPAELRIERYERRGQPQSCVLDLDEAAGVRRAVTPALADVIGRIDGDTPLREVDGAAPEVDGVRALVKLGFLTFA